ncbi:MAM and LDL-receptor class A domain-containing protein 1, partial [Lingula anatina]|uniref:MAM and LDL-receptor class A domain-containing protein 1 n=1 Tax=Lingula anatina TaxID=7574 RepID=A0A1S3IJP1_LINAN
MPRKEGTQMLLGVRLLQVFGFVAFISTVAADTIHSCNFDTDDCGYLSPVSNDFDWTRHTGGTTSVDTGPSSDHTTGSSGHYMYIETSGETPGYIAALLTPSMNSTSGQVCVSFWYHAYGSSLGELHMSLVTSSVYVTRDFSFDGGTSEDRWKYVETSAMLTETSFQVKFDGIRGSGNFGDIAIDDVTVNDTLCAGHVGSASNPVVTALTNTSAMISWGLPSIGTETLQYFIVEVYDCMYAVTPQLTVSEISETYLTVNGLTPGNVYVFAVYANGTNNLARPSNVSQWIDNNQTVLFNCDFDTCGICGMQQDNTDDTDWDRNKGSTLTASTGPSSDHTTGVASGNGAGYYLYFESSSPVSVNDRARVTTPTVNTTNTQACLTFWFHAYGSNLGVFNVRIVTSSGIEVRTIAQYPSSVNSWVQITVPIEEDSFQIQFEAIDANGVESDFAIDDIVIMDGWCEGHSSGIRSPAVTSANDSSVTIQWTAPLLGSSDVQQYTILAYQCMNKTSADHVVSSNFTSVTVTGLAAYSMWTFSILPVTAVASFPETVNITGWTRPLDTAHLCNFDCDTCGYVQATDDEMDWVLNSGSTPTSSTGPTGDHTTGSGNYFYFEVDGGSISSDSTPEKVVFKSNFFGSFAAGLFEPPNTIDFEAVFANFGERLLDNAYVFGFLIALIVIYILTIFYCRWKDKKDKELWAYAPLTDNRPKDSYYYRINVQTAVRSVSRCSANIFFILHGENGKTRPRHLADGERKCFGNGSTNNFTMAVPKYLGRLKYMQVWIDDTGPSPHWLPNKVIMYDIQERKRFYFMGSRWLSATKSDKRTNRLLKSQTEDEFKDFNALFSENASKNFFDDHLWVSIFSRPTTSRFTRVQRLSVSVALLFLGMITNAMFYRGDDEGSSSSGLQIGPITITFRQIWVGLVGALIVLPPAVIMIEIFRRSRERKRSKTPAWTIVAEANINSSGPRIGLEGSKCDLSGDLKKHSFENVNEVDGLSGKGSDEGIGSLGGLGSQKDLQPVATVSDIHIPYTSPALPPQYQDIYYDKTEGSDDTDLLMAFALQPSSNEDFMNTLDHLDESKKKKKPKGPLTLPWGFVIIGYIIVFLSIAASAFFTLLYSLQWGKEKSLGWLLSMFFTIVQSLILVQPIK